MNLLKAYTLITGLAFSMLLTACSSHIPAEIKQPIEGAPDIKNIHLSSADYIGHKVRWGGTILQIENKQDTSWISIVGFPLDSNGRPLQSGESTGRFIAIVGDFLEPLVYANDRQITFSGTFFKTESRKIGEYSYNYPVIKVQQYHLWPVITAPAPDYPPYWWYDPWYDPWYYPAHPHYLRPNP